MEFIWLADWIGMTLHFLTDPLAILLGAIVGGTSKRWWQVFAGAVAAGFVFRLIVLAVNELAREEPFVSNQILGSATAALILGSAVYGVRRWRVRAAIRP